MSPPVVHRMLMVKDKSKVSQAWYTTALIYGLITGTLLIFTLFGIACKEELGLVKGKNVFIHLVKYLFEKHPYMVDIIALGITGILLSTMDSLLHTLGITMVKDVIVPMQGLLGKQELNERRQLTFAKISVLFIGTITVDHRFANRTCKCSFGKKGSCKIPTTLITDCYRPFCFRCDGLKGKYKFSFELCNSVSIPLLWAKSTFALGRTSWALSRS